MTSEVSILEKIDKAKKYFVWVTDLNSHVATTKKEVKKLYIKYKNNDSPNDYRWHLEHVKSVNEYWLYVN